MKITIPLISRNSLRKMHSCKNNNNKKGRRKKNRKRIKKKNSHRKKIPVRKFCKSEVLKE